MTSDRGARTKIIVVSMADAAERRSRFQDRARDAVVAWSFFPARTSLHPSLSYNERDAIIAKGRPLRPGEIGCYSSHYAAWQDLLSGDSDQYVVLEDDVIVDWIFIGQMMAIDFAKIGIDYLRLYYKAPARPALVRENFFGRSRSIVEVSGSAFGTQGYLITKAGAKIFLDHCRVVKRPIDDEMDRSWAHGVPNLAVFPFPIMEEAAPSGIGGARFETYAVPAQLKLKRLVTHRMERWRRDAASAMRRFRRFQTRWHAKT